MSSGSGMWQERVPPTANPVRFFLFASRPQARAAIIATTLALLADIVAASVAYIFKFVANAAAALPAESAYRDLLVACAAYVLFLGLAKGLWRLSGVFASSWAVGARATARYALTSYATLHSRAYFSSRFAGSLANKVGHAARGVFEFVELFLWEFLELVVTAVASFAILFSANSRVALIFLVWVLVLLAVNIFLVRKRVPLSERAHALETELNGATVDLMTNISAMQEYARRPYELRRLRRLVDTRRQAGLRNWRFGELIRVINSLLLVVFGGAMTFTVVWFARIGLVSLGDVILVLTVIFRIEGMLQSLGGNLNKMAEVWGEVKEGLEEIVVPHGIPDAPGAAPLLVRKGEIAIEHLSFTYEAAPVLEDLTLRIGAGERVGLVGRSGAGKSTLVRLLLRHDDLGGGRILIDGTDIARVTQESLRAAVAVVPQEPLLFHRTIAENIAYGRPDAAREEIERAARLAHAHDFIARVPGGYEALVGERGVKLSGGERQRIAIARAILKDAPILLLDEATSALDSESEVAIQEALRKLMEGKTVIAIAHRLSTLREMDRIVVLEGGRIAEDGTHDELLAFGGVYADLWGHQAGGFLRDEEA